MEFLKKRTRNIGFWVSLASLIPLTMQAFGASSVLPDNYQELVNAFLSFLVALGVINNPTTNTVWYTDDKNIKVEESTENVEESTIE